MKKMALKVVLEARRVESFKVYLFNPLLNMIERIFVQVTANNANANGLLGKNG